jgi:NitT/TauT family transport system ATP-binding protein
MTSVSDEPMVTNVTNEATSARTVIRTDDVRFAYPDGTLVLDGISEAVPEGKTLGVVGPSGCGKSTLLALVAGLIQPSAGSVQLVTDASDRHPLSMLFQKETLLPWLTVSQNVALYSRFKGNRRRRGIRANRMPRRSLDPVVQERVTELLHLVKLEEHADKYPYQLSGGMRRRLAFLSTIAPDPQILLLDEPFSALDEPTRIGIHQDVFKIARSMNTTMLLVTHDLAEALTLCDRVIILSQRPATVAIAHSVPFGDVRDMLELRASEDFLHLYGELWHDLSLQMGSRR